jgi:predicted phage-related endonuclease
MALSNAQLQERKRGIFATDAPAALGLSKYSSPVQVWMEKTGQHLGAPEQEVSEAQEMGHVMQPVIAGLYAKKYDVQLKDLENVTLWHPSINFMGSHFDYLRDDGSNTLVEIKNFHPMRKKEFGDDGSQDVPMDCLIQCVHEAIVWNTRKVDLAVLFGGQSFKVYPLEITQKTIDLVIDREQRFWQMVVEKEAPPPIDPEETRRLFPKDNGSTIICSTDVNEAFRQLVTVREQIKMLDDLKNQLSAKVQAGMGEASILSDAHGKVMATWKAGKPVRRVDTEALKAANLYMEFSKESPASRTFLVKE